MRTAAIFLFSLLNSSCQFSGAGGSFPGGTEESAKVTLAQLAEYCRESSKGLITPSSQVPEEANRSLAFSWDPYDKLRVLAPFRVSPEVLRDLFQFDAERKPLPSSVEATDTAAPLLPPGVHRRV